MALLSVVGHITRFSLGFDNTGCRPGQITRNNRILKNVFLLGRVRPNPEKLVPPFFKAFLVILSLFCFEPLFFIKSWAPLFFLSC